MDAQSRKLRRKECVGKTRFDSMGRAQKAAYSYFKNFGRKMNGYKCSFCHGYHIGGRDRGGSSKG